MRLHLFLNRMALLCNVLFLICLVIQRTHDFIHSQGISNYIILLGWLVSPFLNVIVSGWWLFAKLTRKAILSKWLPVINGLFLLLQFFVYFII